MQGASSTPTWLVVLQALSYSFSIAAVFATAIVYFASGARFRGRAFVDSHGQVAVEIYNRGRLAGTIVFIGLARNAPRKMRKKDSTRKKDSKWYPMELAGKLPVSMAPGGFEEFRFGPVVDLKGVHVRVRYGAGDYHRISLKSISGEFAAPPEDQGPPEDHSSEGRAGMRVRVHRLLGGHRTCVGNQ
jgi:hypothetical protein